MFFSNLTRRRLAALLRPWLREEPELDLSLGFINSRAIVKNLRFDASVLNELVDGGSGFRFEDVTVGEFTVRFSNWSVPAISFEISGVNVTLSLRDLKEERDSRPVPKRSDSSSDECIKKKLSQLDPEGSVLHNVLEKIAATSTGNKFKTAFLSLILKHCRLEMHNLNVQVNLPTSDDSCSCILHLKELNAESQCLDFGCLFRGLVGSSFVPVKETSHVLIASGFEIVLNMVDRVDRVLLSANLFSRVKFYDLRLTGFTLRVPELSVSFSPADLSVCLAFGKVSSEDHRCGRNGKQLWKLAARRVNHVISSPGLKFQNLVTAVGLWLRYVNAYDHMLQLVGYSTDNDHFKRTVIKIFQNKMALRFAKQCWKVISDIEKELPAESIAQARRIARNRAAVNLRSVVFRESYFATHLKLFGKIFLLLGFIWNLILKLLHVIICLLTFRWKLAREPVSEALEIVTNDSSPEFFFILNLDRILVTISPINEIHLSEFENLESQIGVPFSGYASVSLSVDALLLKHVVDICEESLIVSCGQFKIDSSSVVENPRRQGSSKRFRRPVKGNWDADMKSILWCEPAQSFLLSESSNTCTSETAKGTSDPHLENFLGEMWLNWRRTCMKFEKSVFLYSETPFLLFETRSVLVYPGIGNSKFGLLKCFFTLGKIHLGLGCSSIVSIAILFRQMQHALCRDGENEKSKVHSNAPRTVEDPPETSWDGVYKFYANSLTLKLVKMLPEKQIQLAVFMAGPCIKLSLEKEFSGHNEGSGRIALHDGFHLGFEVENIEVSIWPNSTSESTSDKENPELDDAAECTRLKQPQTIEMPKSENANYISDRWILLDSYARINGVNAYLGNSVNKQKSQIFVLQPVTVQFSSSREYFHSLSTNTIALSAALCALATGLNVLSYIDEFYVLSKVVGNLNSAVSYVFSSFDSGTSISSDGHRQKIAPTEPQIEEETGDATTIDSKILYSVGGVLKLSSVDLTLQRTRINDDQGSSTRISDALSRNILDEFEFPDCGISVSLRQTSIDVSCEEQKSGVSVEISEIQSVIFGYQNKKQKSVDQSVHKDIMLQSCVSLYEISLSNCLFSFSLFLPQNTSSSMSMHNKFGGLTSGSNALSWNVDNQLGGSISQSNTSYLDNSFDSEISSSQTIDTVQNLRSASNTQSPDPSHSMLVDVELGMVYVGSCPLKNALVGAHDMHKLLLSLSVVGEFQTMSWEIQGGLLFLEAKAFEKFIFCFISYLRTVTNILFGRQLFDKDIEKTEHNVDVTRIDDYHISEHPRETQTPAEATGESIQVLTINVSQLSTVFVIADTKGGVKELVLDFDVHLNFKLANMTRTVTFDLKRLSFLSQVLQQSSSENDSPTPHFYSVSLDNNMSTQFEYGDSSSEHQPLDAIYPLDDPSSSRDSESLEKHSATSSVPKIYDIICQKHVLKHLCASLSVKKYTNCRAWVGNGSTSGFDIILSLPEIEMILCIMSSFSEISSKVNNGALEKNQRSSNIEESDCTFEAMIPDGSVVAIQDVQQHMYFAVDSKEHKYNLSGTVHYSLVGERALFRVKYHIQRKWRSSILWFSLTSLHAKNESGVPFRLNYCSGSGFVDVSSTDDGAWACWRILPCVPESSEGDIEWEPQNKLIKNQFYLVNKKNDCSVAFVDGVPEFVSKPGNQFKFKVFDDQSIARDFRNIDCHPVDDSGTTVENNASLNGNTSERSGKFPSIDVVLEKISLTIVHELSDSSDVIPLLRASIDGMRLNIQLLSTKARVISTLTAAVYHFDSKTSEWRELLHPLKIFLYYRSNFPIQNSEASVRGIPVHIHCRTKELSFSLTEPSLDLLLFVIGKLNLAGPYSLKSFRIPVNCCKVENQTGINLLCNFSNKQSVKVARNQSTSIFLRYSDLEKQPQQSAYVSFQLAALGSFQTSSVRLSLLRSQKLAWRTRIMSSQDSRSYPGPFLVVDLSRESEDGLLIVVSPLIRIHNKTQFSMELQFRRPQQTDEFASVELNSGDTIDDPMAMFDALHLSGGLKKALTSISLGNFLLSFRPKISEDLIKFKSSISVEWSGVLKGGKAVRLSGILDKLSYSARKAFFTEAVKCSFSTVQCSLQSDGSHIADMHFLIQSIVREVPVVLPNNSKEGFEFSSSPVTLLEQKEIFVLPTVKVSNLVQSEIRVILSETDACSDIGDNALNQATISCGSSADFFVNPSIFCLIVTLTDCNSSSNPVNSSDWVKRLQKQKTEAQYLDIDLDFGGGSYFASLRLSRGHRGILEATVFTSYALKNDTDFHLYFFASNRRPLPRHEVEKFGSGTPPDLGLLVPPKSTKSWFLKSNKVCLKLLEDNASEALLDLDALSGLTEISLELEESTGVKSITKLGVSMGPALGKVVVPSNVVTMVPRYVLVNESDEPINVRQCYLQDDTAGITVVNSRQRTTLQMWNMTSKRSEFSFIESLIRNQRKANGDTLMHIQFRPNDHEFGWSGPVCIASLGRFFLKFRKHQSGEVTFAAVHVVEEGSTLVLHFRKPPNVNLPYRIENHLPNVSITYFQKDSAETEVLASEHSVDYIWDDLTLPRRLVVRINDSHLLREINLDKVRDWKPVYKLGQHLGLAYHFLWDKNSEIKSPNSCEFKSMEMVRIGYEVYADGPTRVLRICEISKSHKGKTVFQTCKKIQLRVPQFTIQLLEQGTEDGNETRLYLYTPIIAARFSHFSLDSLFTDQQNYNQIDLQSFTIEEKWVGAPFAAMLRRQRVDNPESNDRMLRIVFVLLSTSSDVIQVQYSSIALQPVDLNLDEETLMKIVPFWRTSLSDSNSKSRQFYFDHFEIQPIKIITNFLPGDSYSSYSSAQETLRSLLHSVIKVPPIKNMVVELNGVLVTHALITMRELFIRCAQHYSWYAMRAIYIAKGSPLLPPDFVSMFDDLASSSLDVFFDPSRGLTNLPGLTLGTFKLISKCIGGKGFSGTKRYFGDLGKSLQTAGSNVLFAAVTEVSDSVLKGAEASGLNGMVIGFHQGIMKLAMEPSLLGSALMEGGPDRKIKLDRSPGADELYVEGYLQAMLDTLYRQEYLRVRVIDNQVYLKNLPPNNALIEEITDHVKGFLVSKALLKGDPSRISHPLRHLRGESEWRLGPTLLTLCEHLFVSFTIRMLRKQANKIIANAKWNKDSDADNQKAIVPKSENNLIGEQKIMFIWRWGIGRFVLSGLVAYVDGRLCRCIPNPIARRIVSGFLLTFLDRSSDEVK